MKNFLISLLVFAVLVVAFSFVKSPIELTTPKGSGTRFEGDSGMVVPGERTEPLEVVTQTEPEDAFIPTEPLEVTTQTEQVEPSETIPQPGKVVIRVHFS